MILWRENHGHSIMQWLHQVIRISGDDRIGLKDASSRPVLPAIPQTRKRKDISVSKLDRPRLLVFFVEFLPLVEACCGNQTSSALHGFAEHRTRGHGFSAGVHGGIADLGVLREKRNQAPPQKGKLPIGGVSVQPNDGLRGLRGDVV